MCPFPVTESHGRLQSPLGLGVGAISFGRLRGELLRTMTDEDVMGLETDRRQDGANNTALLVAKEGRRREWQPTSSVRCRISAHSVLQTSVRKRRRDQNP